MGKKGIHTGFWWESQKEEEYWEEQNMIMIPARLGTRNDYDGEDQQQFTRPPRREEANRKT
jgi:hypothetical protein